MTNEQLSDGTMRRLEAMQDQSGFTVASSKKKLGLQTQSGSTEIPTTSKIRPFTSPFTTPTDGDKIPVGISGRDAVRIKANIDAMEHPVDPETQSKVNARGAALAREALQETIGSISDRTADELPAPDPAAYDPWHEAESADRVARAIRANPRKR